MLHSHPRPQRISILLLPALLGLACPLPLRPAPVARSTADAVSPTRIVAVGDLHGDLPRSLQVLRLTGLIDTEGAWIGGRSRLVQTGDILDRGDGERAIIDLFQRLRVEARAAGGEVVNLNGNHELMTARGDHRHATAGSCEAFVDLPEPAPISPALAEADASCRKRAAAFQPGGSYARVLAGWPVVAQLDDSVFVHGGLQRAHLRLGLSAINARVGAYLRGELDDGAPPLPGVAREIVWSRTYSGNPGPSPADCGALSELLQQLGARRLVMGHSVQDEINAACDGMAWRIDAGLSGHYGGPLAALEIVDGEARVLSELGN